MNTGYLVKVVALDAQTLATAPKKIVCDHRQITVIAMSPGAEELVLLGVENGSIEIPLSRGLKLDLGAGQGGEGETSERRAGFIRLAHPALATLQVVLMFSNPGDVEPFLSARSAGGSTVLVPGIPIFISIAGAYTATGSWHSVLCDTGLAGAGITINLQFVNLTEGRWLRIVNTGAFPVTVNGNGNLIGTAGAISVTLLGESCLDVEFMNARWRIC